MRARRRTWMLAGGGLIACGVLGMLQTSLLGSPAGPWVGVSTDVLFAAAVLLFAIGTSRGASVVARRPLGVVALAVLAVWPLASTVMWSLPLFEQGEDGMAALVYVSLGVPAAAGMVAVVQIARAGVVPAPWRWAPLWVLVVQAAVWAVPQLILVSVGSAEVQSLASLLLLLSTLGFLAGTLGLGILALVLAAQTRPDTVGVYRSG